MSSRPRDGPTTCPSAVHTKEGTSKDYVTASHLGTKECAVLYGVRVPVTAAPHFTADRFGAPDPATEFPGASTWGYEASYVTWHAVVAWDFQHRRIPRCRMASRAMVSGGELCTPSGGNVCP